jgi:hypothetical protein
MSPMLSMRSSHSRPAESLRAFTNRVASSSWNSSDLLGYLAPLLAEHMLSAFDDLQEANQLG